MKKRRTLMWSKVPIYRLVSSLILGSELRVQDYVPMARSWPGKKLLLIQVFLAGVGPENTANSKGSTDSVGNSAASQKTNLPRSYEDRPILGALTLEELKQHSASRKCRSQSPDETPIIGTVGSYWNHTGQIVDADSSSLCKGTPRTRCRNIQEERSKWNAIPFEARLERALDTGTAGV